MRIIRANGIDEYGFIEELKKRNQSDSARAGKVAASIIKDVKENGDAAVEKYTLKFDRALPETMEAPRGLIEEAERGLKPELREAIRRAAENIREYHCEQKPSPYEIKRDDGVIIGRKCRGLRRVGLYVPGGRASYPSTVLMNVIPAKLAGVDEIIMATPPGADGGVNAAVLAAAYIAGVDRVFLMGGAQAIAAMAYGTETVPKVDKIVGPGNAYVNAAKKLLYGEVDIDILAGPSEILIIADESANAAYIAADLLSQAEHDVMASSILVTHSVEIAIKAAREIKRQIDSFPEKKVIINQALANYGAIFLTRDMDESVKLSNLLAPEHLEVMTDKPFETANRLVNAGALFLGHYTPEPIGDFFAGTNHVLPTGMTARFFSPLSVESFLKYYSYAYYTREALARAAGYARELAGAEGFPAHAAAIDARARGKD